MKVWVTRDEPPPPDGALSTALLAEGLEVIHEPVIKRTIVNDARAEIDALGHEDWVVLTSAYAVEAINRSVVPCRIAVVGMATRSAAISAGLRVDHLSTGGTAADLFAELRPHARGKTICYPRSSKSEVPEVEAGVTLVCPVVYRTTKRRYRRGVHKECEVIAVASPSAARAIGQIAKPCASIGPTTSAALRELGVEPWVEAADKSFVSLAEAIATGS
jgi:uroporphyrinogen-III synthase